MVLLIRPFFVDCRIDRASTELCHVLRVQSKVHPHALTVRCTRFVQHCFLALSNKKAASIYLIAFHFIRKSIGPQGHYPISLSRAVHLYSSSSAASRLQVRLPA